VSTVCEKMKKMSGPQGGGFFGLTLYILSLLQTAGTENSKTIFT